MSETSIGADLHIPGTRGELTALLREFRTAILVTTDERGMPRARPLVIAKCETDGSMWFATSDHSPKVAEIARDPNVAVICHRTRDEAWISISGHAELVRDQWKIDELWDPGMRAWFEGRDDPALLLIRVTPAHAEYYAPNKPFVARAFELVKGMVTKEPPRTGPVKHVELDRLSDPGRLSQ